MQSLLVPDTVPVLVTALIAALEFHDQEVHWAGKGLFGLYFHIAVHH